MASFSPYTSQTLFIFTKFPDKRGPASVAHSTGKGYNGFCKFGKIEALSLGGESNLLRRLTRAIIRGFAILREISFQNMNVELSLARVVSPLFSENCYIAWLAGRPDCVVVDPGIDADSVVELLDQQKLAPAAILNTHGHADHIAGNDAIKQRWPDSPLLIGEKDAPKLSDPEQNLSSMYGRGFTSPPADQLVRHGDTLSFAGIEFEVRETPGHSIGHVVFVFKGNGQTMVFGGDVLFAGSIGRTDFPDGDHAQLLRSIREQLFTLPDDTLVLPGHGDPTRIADERATNPFVSGGT